MFFSDAKLEKLSDITGDVAQIFFASMFVGPFLVEAANWLIVTAGLMLSLIFWSFPFCALLIRRWARHLANQLAAGLAAIFCASIRAASNSLAAIFSFHPPFRMQYRT